MECPTCREEIPFLYWITEDDSPPERTTLYLIEKDVENYTIFDDDGNLLEWRRRIKMNRIEPQHLLTINELKTKREVLVHQLKNLFSQSISYPFDLNWYNETNSNQLKGLHTQISTVTKRIEHEMRCVLFLIDIHGYSVPEIQENPEIDDCKDEVPIEISEDDCEEEPVIEPENCEDDEYKTAAPEDKKLQENKSASSIQEDETEELKATRAQRYYKTLLDC